MISRKNIRFTLAVAVLGLFISISVVQAEEPYDLTMCMSGQVSMMSATKELVIYSWEGNGITMDNLEKKAFDNLTYRCIGITKIVSGVRHQLGYCKYMDADGDLVVGESTRVGKEGSWKFLQGTGKWKGITGGGPAGTDITKGKPISEGTFQVCQRAKGTYELP